MSGIFNRLELDVMQHNELLESVEIAFKHGFPAIIVHPGLASEAIVARGRVGGRFKIITPVDWPKGDIFGQVKFRGLSTDALDTDGFEIMLTGSKLETETRNEARILTEFIRHHLSPLTEVRFVLGTSLRSDANIETLCRGLLHIPTPTMVRTDIQLKLQVSKANPDEHNRYIALINSIVNVPIKLSGNINSVRCITATHASRFAVNLLQARTIIKEFRQQPDGLKNLLNTHEPSPDVPPVS